MCVEYKFKCAETKLELTSKVPGSGKLLICIMNTSSEMSSCNRQYCKHCCRKSWESDVNKIVRVWEMRRLWRCVCVSNCKTQLWLAENFHVCVWLNLLRNVHTLLQQTFYWGDPTICCNFPYRLLLHPPAIQFNAERSCFFYYN